MSGSPKHTRITPRDASAITRIQREEQQRRKHRTQIGQSKLRGERSREKAREGLLTPEAETRLRDTLARLAAVGSAIILDQLQREESQAAEYAREIEGIAGEALRCAAARDTLTALSTRSIAAFSDPELMRQAQAEAERARWICGQLEAGEVTLAAAHAEHHTIEKQWAAIEGAQTTLTDMQALAEDLLEIGVNVSAEFEMLRSGLREDVLKTQARSAEFIDQVNAALNEAQKRSVRRMLELEDRWGTILARMETIDKQAQSFLRLGEVSAPEQVRTCRALLEALKQHVRQRGDAGAAAAFETMAYGVEAALQILRDEIKAATEKEQALRGERERAKASLTTALDEAITKLGKSLNDGQRRSTDEIRHEIDNLAYAVSENELRAHKDAVEERISRMTEAVAESPAALVLREIATVLRRTERQMNLVWSEGSLDNLIRRLSAGQEAMLNGRADDDTSISWTFSVNGDAVEIMTDDGEGRSCDASRYVWGELSDSGYAQVMVREGEGELKLIEPHVVDDGPGGGRGQQVPESRERRL